MKNTPTSKLLGEKADTKKRPTTTGDAPPPKKSKCFTAKKKVQRTSLPKVEKSLKSEDMTTIVPFVGDGILMPFTAVKQPDEVILLESPKKAEGQSTQPDATKEGSAFSSHVARVVSQMPSAYRSASLSSSESYYSNMVKTLRVGGRPMSPSKRLIVVIPVRNIDDSPLSNKGMGLAEVVCEASPVLSDDESSVAFARMTSVEREKLKQEVF